MQNSTFMQVSKMRKPFHYYYFCLFIDCGATISGTIAAIRAAILGQTALMLLLIFLSVAAGATTHRDFSEYLTRIGKHPTCLYATHFDQVETIERIPIMPYNIYYVEAENMYYYDYWNIKGKVMRRKITPDEFAKYTCIDGII